MSIVKYIPNTITSINLLCGVMGVIAAFEGKPDISFYLMLAAAAFDFCDGLSARLLNAYSNIGKELDSLCDMVSFGVLPAILLHRMMIETGTDGFLSYLPLAIAVFSGLRLAKFNIDERQSENFIGLATPACAILCASFVSYASGNPESVLYNWASCRFFIPIGSFILSALLVSNIPMFSMKFKKNAQNAAHYNRLRIAFAVLAAISVSATAILKLNWQFAVILTFVSYIILNIFGALLPGSMQDNDKQNG